MLEGGQISCLQLTPLSKVTENVFFFFFSKWKIVFLEVVWLKNGDKEGFRKLVLPFTCNSSTGKAATQHSIFGNGGRRRQSFFHPLEWSTHTHTHTHTQRYVHTYAGPLNCRSVRPLMTLCCWQTSTHKHSLQPHTHTLTLPLLMPHSSAAGQPRQSAGSPVSREAWRRSRSCRTRTSRRPTASSQPCCAATPSPPSPSTPPSLSPRRCADALCELDHSGAPSSFWSGECRDVRPGWELCEGTLMDGVMSEEVRLLSYHCQGFPLTPDG